MTDAKNLSILIANRAKKKQQQDIDQAKKYWKDYQLED